MKKVFDGMFEVPGDGCSGDWISYYWLRLYQDTGNKCVSIITDLSTTQRASGTSITNCAEWIATKIIYQFGISPNKLALIEHYPTDANEATRSIRKTQFTYVDLVWKENCFGDPKWRQAEPTLVEALIGESFKPIPDVICPSHLEIEKMSANEWLKRQNMMVSYPFLLSSLLNDGILNRLKTKLD